MRWIDLPVTPSQPPVDRATSAAWRMGNDGSVGRSQWTMADNRNKHRRSQVTATNRAAVETSGWEAQERRTCVNGE